MTQYDYINHNEGNKGMNHVSIADIASLSSIAVAVGSIVYWGGGIEKRLKAVEGWKDDIEDRQTRIENKIDNLAHQTTSRLDLVQQNIIDAIIKR